MAIQIKPLENKEDQVDNRVEVRIDGRLTSHDYETFVPEIENWMKRYGKIRILLELVNFHGWTAGALWEDTKFAVRHFSDIDRVAVVGDRAWEKGMATFCKPFTAARIRYFDVSETNDARRWIQEA